MMERIKDFFSIKKHIYYTIIGVGIFLLIIIALIVTLIVTKRYTYHEIENMMVTEAKSYMKSHKDFMPNADNLVYEIDTGTLVSEKRLKDLAKLSKDTNCHGSISVSYNNNSYRYTPTLICDNYETKDIKTKILEKEDIVTDEDGLYEMDNGYRFKGDYVNNYLSFANKLWRIFKITNDNILYLVLADTVNDKNSAVVFDDRYNEEAESGKGRSDFDESRIKETLMNIYNNDLKSHSAYITIHDACKNSRSEIDTDMSGAIECNTISKTPISLMAIYDYIMASRDVLCLNTMSLNCTNNNYLANTKNRWWLLNGSNEYSYKIYFASPTGSINLDNANVKKNLRYVITISSQALFNSGNGTKDNPYTIYEY